MAERTGHSERVSADAAEINVGSGSRAVETRVGTG